MVGRKYNFKLRPKQILEMTVNFLISNKININFGQNYGNIGLQVLVVNLTDLGPFLQYPVKLTESYPVEFFR